MRAKRVIPATILLVLVIVLGIVLAACGAAAPATQMGAPAPQLEMPAPTMSSMDGYAGAEEGLPQAAAPPQATAAPNVDAAKVAPQSFPGSGHMIIKNGDMRLLVADTDRALDGVTQVVGDTDGYVISSRVWFQDYYGTNYKYATLTIGVPVDQFEPALRRIRALAVRVQDDNASGEDVTSQYVDLQSQLGNLEATRDRIRSFLKDAKTVDEALRINQQLSDVEVQIEKIKGQMNYLSNRSAFSTITINLEPQLPEVVMTPTPTMTPTPIPGLGPWDPGKTTQRATNTLVSAYRVIVDALIWIFVVLVPIFGPPILLIWLVVWLIGRRMRKAPRG
jgi:hypothetical protein